MRHKFFFILTLCIMASLSFWAKDADMGVSIYSRGINVIPLPQQVTVERQKMLDACQVAPVDSGLWLKMADARCLTLKELDAQTEWKDSILSRVEDIAHLRPNKFANVVFYVAQANGYIFVQEDGIYEFRSDNTQVSVDGVVAVDNDGKPQVNSSCGRSVALRKGWHKCNVKQISNFIGGWNSQHRNSGAVSLRKYGTSDWQRATFYRL